MLLDIIFPSHFSISSAIQFRYCRAQRKGETHFYQNRHWRSVFPAPPRLVSSYTLCPETRFIATINGNGILSLEGECFEIHLPYISTGKKDFLYSHIQCASSPYLDTILLIRALYLPYMVFPLFLYLRPSIEYCFLFLIQLNQVSNYQETPFAPQYGTSAPPPPLLSASPQFPLKTQISSKGL